jgi:hypothetical protein
VIEALEELTHAVGVVFGRRRPGWISPGLLALGSTCICGCVAEERTGATPEAPAPGSYASAAGAGVTQEPLSAQPVFYATAPGPDHLIALPEWDVGTGFVRIPPSPVGPPGTAPTDTIRILSDARPDAPPVARAHHQEYRLIVEAAEPQLLDGALEVGYEERALPVIGTGPDGVWVEVAFAFGSDGVQRTGWVDVSDARVERVSWSQWLEEAGVLYFLNPDSISFFDAPGGQLLGLSLVPVLGSRQYDYALYPLAFEGPWMQVRISSPSDYCADPTAPLEARGWIRFLDPTGRPRVWYPTRGC